MVQASPRYREPSTEKTEIWVSFDGDNIYVSAKVWDQAPPEKWIANELRRDTNQMRNNDHFGVGFDTFYDRRSGFMFYANPLGGFADYSVVDEGSPNTDWNPVWQAKTGRFDGGWTIEMAFPFKSLRYTSGDEPDLGHPVPPRDPSQERVDLLDAGAAQHGRSPGPQPGLGVWHGGRSRPAAGRPQPRDQALRARPQLDRPRCRTRRSRATTTARLAATSSTASPRT